MTHPPSPSSPLLLRLSARSHPPARRLLGRGHPRRVGDVYLAMKRPTGLPPGDCLPLHLGMTRFVMAEHRPALQERSSDRRGSGGPRPTGGSHCTSRHPRRRATSQGPVPGPALKSGRRNEDNGYDERKRKRNSRRPPSSALGRHAQHRGGGPRPCRPVRIGAGRTDERGVARQRPARGAR